jgi:hypothetical protein
MRRRRVHLALSLAMLSLLGPALMLLLSLHTPILGARLLIWVPLPFFVLVGVGVSGLRRWLWTGVFCLTIGALTMPRIARTYEFLNKERWREMHAAMLPRATSDTLIVTATRQENVALGYYFQRQTNPLTPIPIVEDPDSPMRYRGDRDQALMRIRSAGHLFLIDRKRGSRNRARFEALLARGKLVSTVYWDKIRIDEFVLKRRGGFPQLGAMVGGTGESVDRKHAALRRER